MNNNREQMNRIIDYIEEHLQDESLDLQAIAAFAGYSKYHCHRLFTVLTGVPVHRYIQRRRITEAARRLVCTTEPILKIALDYGYQTQRSFSRQFRIVYHCSPKLYRNRKTFLPLQNRLEIKENKPEALRNFKIQIVDHDMITLVGYRAKPLHGFGAISRSWRKLHQNQQWIASRSDMDFLIGVNVYEDFTYLQDKPVFTYWAGAQVSSLEGQADQILPKGMNKLKLPASRYVVFEYRGQCQDSLEPVIEMIYGQWFPMSSCLLNENARYDLVKYGEQIEEQGRSDIQVWIPIL